jgi:hypothetical protein
MRLQTPRERCSDVTVDEQDIYDSDDEVGERLRRLHANTMAELVPGGRAEGPAGGPPARAAAAAAPAAVDMAALGDPPRAIPPRPRNVEREQTVARLVDMGFAEVSTSELSHSGHACHSTSVVSRGVAPGGLNRRLHAPAGNCARSVGCGGRRPGTRYRNPIGYYTGRRRCSRWW